MTKTVTPAVRRPSTLPVSLMDGEPRVLDTALAEQLGFAEPRMIRKLIERHRDELEAFGGLFHRVTNPGPKGGRPGTAYYLNREQALLVCILSDTPKAKQVRAEVVRVFTAHERVKPSAAPIPALPTDFREALVALIAQIDETKKLSHTVNFITVDAYRALPALRSYKDHTSWKHGLKSKLGKTASRMCCERGIEVGKEDRTYFIRGKAIENEVGKYPREVLDEAFAEVAPQYLDLA